jgi:DNA-binding MarR family transcriptional regulator
MATSRAMRKGYDLWLSQLDLNLTEALLLAEVDARGPVSQSQLAERLGLGRPATGDVIDHLVRSGLVTRRADPTDRRVWLVAATEQGHTVAGQIADLDRQLRQRLREGIGKDERTQLAKTLLRLQANLGAMMADPQAPTTGRSRPAGLDVGPVRPVDEVSTGP